MVALRKEIKGKNFKGFSVQHQVWLSLDVHNCPCLPAITYRGEHIKGMGCHSQNTISCFFLEKSPPITICGNDRIKYTIHLFDANSTCYMGSHDL